MSQYLPTSNFEKLYFPEEYELDQFVEDLRFIPVGNEYDYFKESDIEYPAENREKKPKTFHFVLIKQKQIQSCLQRT